MTVTTETTAGGLSEASDPTEPLHPQRVYAVHRMAIAALWSVVLALIGARANIPALALIGGYGVVFLGIGGAPFQLRPDLDPYTRIAGSVLVGFSVLLGVGALMGDLSGAWHPVTAAVIVGIPAAWLHIRGLRRAKRTVALSKRAAAWTRVQARIAAHNAGAPMPAIRYEKPALSRTATVSLISAGVGTLLWLVPAAVTRDSNPSFWGMLTKLGPFWYLGLVLVLVGFVIGRRHELCAAVATLSFGVASTLTPALVYGEPREQTALKQMQLTQYTLIHHHTQVTAGIYQAYSSMFSGMAWLCELLRIHGLLGPMSLFTVATYWPVLLVLMRVAAVRCLAGRLLPTTGRRWCAVMLVLLVDSLGADYYSPQSIGYVMAIAAVAFAINGERERPLGTRWTLCLMTLAGVGLAPTHELSPYMAAGALFVLAMFGEAPWWSCLPIALPAFAWAGVVHNAIRHNFNFGALFDLGNFRPPTTTSFYSLHRLPIVGYQSHTLLLALLILIGIGGIGFVANIHRRFAWAYAICPIVGIGFIAINPYGNEGIFRAALFAIPWMVILAMKMPDPADFGTVIDGPAAFLETLSHRRFLGWFFRILIASLRGLRRAARALRIRRRRRSRVLALFRRDLVLSSGIATCLIVLLATFVVAAYGMDGTNVLPRDDVAVVRYLTGLPSHNSFVDSIGFADDPADGALYTLNYSPLEWIQVASARELQTLHPTSIDPIALADQFGIVAQNYGASRNSPLYMIWARTVVLYTKAYGLNSPQQMLTWLHLMKTSSEWKLVKHVGSAYLFRLRY